MAVTDFAAGRERGWSASVRRAMRPVLWIGVVFNALVAMMLLFPWAFGAALPPIGSVFYLWMLVYFVALFSATYAWLALQPHISRPVVGLAALGKLGVFVVSLACLVRGDIPPRTFLVAVADLVFALYFLAWLRASGHATTD
jgi:hypothetical protein